MDTGDGQGEWNGDRVRQAESLAAFADELVGRAGDPDVLLLGDFNAYTQEDPIERLRDAGFVDLGERLDPGRYSYVFDDQSGSLDHALARGALAAQGHRPDALEHQRGRVVRLPVRRRPGAVRARPVPVQRPRPAGARHRPERALPGPAADDRRHPRPRRAPRHQRRRT